MSSSHSTESSSSEPAPGLRGSKNANNLLVLLPDRINIEEEAQFYDDIVDVSGRAPSPTVPIGSQLLRGRARAPSRATTRTAKTIRPRSRRTRRSRSSRTTSGSGTTRARARRSRATSRSRAGRASGTGRAARTSVSAPALIVPHPRQWEGRPVVKSPDKSVFENRSCSKRSETCKSEVRKGGNVLNF